MLDSRPSLIIYFIYSVCVCIYTHTHTVLYICQPQFPNLSYPPFPLGDHSLFSMPNLCLYFCFVNKLICTPFLYSTYKWYHLIFVFLCVTWYHHLYIYPCSDRWDCFVIFHGQVIFRGVYIHHIFFIHLSVDGVCFNNSEFPSIFLWHAHQMNTSPHIKHDLYQLVQGNRHWSFIRLSMKSRNKSRVDVIRMLSNTLEMKKFQKITISQEKSHNLITQQC